VFFATILLLFYSFFTSTASAFYALIFPFFSLFYTSSLHPPLPPSSPSFLSHITKKVATVRKGGGIQLYAMYSLGIRKILKTNTLICPLEKVRHPTASTRCLCWTSVVGKTHFQKCSCKYNVFLQCYGAVNVNTT
jgi:hypothetical protein